RPRARRRSGRRPTRAAVVGRGCRRCPTARAASAPRRRGRVRPRGRAGRGAARRAPRSSLAPGVAAAPARLLVALLEISLVLTFEVVGELVDGRADVRRRLPGADRRTLGEDRPLGDVTRRDRRIVLLRELDLDLRRLGEPLPELAELGLGVLAD